MSAQLSLLTSRSVPISVPVSGRTSPESNRPPLNQSISSAPNRPPPSLILAKSSPSACVKTSERPWEACDRRSRMPFGSRPASSANRQNRIRSRKWATASGSWPRARRLWAISAKWRGGLLGDLGRLDARAELLGRGEDVAQQAAGRRTGRRPPRSSSVIVVERPGSGPVKLVWISIRVEVADDEERRVARGRPVAQELDVGGLQVLALALVLPGEEVALPDVGEAVPPAGLGDALLEGVGARRSGRPRGASARRASGTGR